MFDRYQCTVCLVNLCEKCNGKGIRPESCDPNHILTVILAEVEEDTTNLQVNDNRRSSVVSVVDTENIEKCKKYREEAVQNLIELVSTEKNYLKELMEIMKYKDYTFKSKKREEGVAPMPEGLMKGKDKIAFGNIQEILDIHQK